MYVPNTVACGSGFTVTIDENGLLKLFGKFADNVNNTSFDVDDIVSVVCGDYHIICIGRTGNVWSFGNNNKGQTGSNNIYPTTKPKLIDLNPNIQIVNASCGDQHTICLDQLGRAFSFGFNSNGQLGLGHTQDVNIPTEVQQLENIKSIHCGGFFSIFLMEYGIAFGAGFCYKDQFGIPTLNEEFLKPREIPNIEGITSASVGANHILFLLDNGDVYSCGVNFMGQCGRFGNTFSISKINNIPSMNQILCAGNTSFFIDHENNLWSCGFNLYGQLGNSSTRSTLFPTKITNFSGVLSVASSGHHTLVKLHDGSIYVFGLNSNRELLGFSKKRCIELLKCEKEMNSIIAAPILPKRAKSARK